MQSAVQFLEPVVGSMAGAMSGETVRKIIHVDMDAFYASVEQRDNPELRGKPVAVGGSRARGVVAAASYEARKFGVRSAMASVTAIRRCPSLIFVRPRFDHYRDISRQIRAIFFDYTPLVEPLSLDEAYLDVTFNSKQMPSATLIAEEIRARILETTGLTASAGVSYNKFLAKLASDYRKPNGQYVITPAKGPAFVETLEVGKFHGVGPVTAAKFNRLGIFTGADLRRQSIEFLQLHFGKSGPHFYDIARGLDDRLVQPDRERKSIGSENTFAQDLMARADIESGIEPLANEVWGHCVASGIAARTVTLKVKYNDFQIITRSRTSATPIAGKPMLDAMLAELIEGLFPLPKSVRLLGVSLSNLDHGDEPAEEDRQMTLKF